MLSNILSFPRFVIEEFDDYLAYGQLEHGFLRVKCDGCLHEHLVAFSCKSRGFCPFLRGTQKRIRMAGSEVDIPETIVSSMTFQLCPFLMATTVAITAPITGAI